jgi:hypothetical protein
VALWFSNVYPEPIWACLLLYDPSCGPANQNFRKLGWWYLKSGAIRLVWNVNLADVNRWAYYYAESAHDGANWSGLNAGVGETNNAWANVNVLGGFNQCFLDNTNCDQWVPCAELDFAWNERGWDLLVNFDVVRNERTGALGPTHVDVENAQGLVQYSP